MSINILQPGLFTTIQDIGRYGFRKEGIIVSGAMDKMALRIGNLLVGNDEKQAAIEITQLGPTILFQEDCVIAITGAHLSPVINQKPVPMWKTVLVQTGTVLEFGKLLHGYRAYITFAGGLAVEEVLGSYSTYVKAGIGGWHGRALQKGDTIPCKNLASRSLIKHYPIHSQQEFKAVKWTIKPSLLPQYKEKQVIRVMQGPEFGWFTAESQHHFWQAKYTISHQSDRMGYRIEGNPLKLEVTRELISSAVTFGTIQVPASGNPIILMADHQTTGGYPRIGQVASVDLPVLAQASPGCSISFQEVSLQEAQHLYIAQEKNIQLIKRALSLRRPENLFQ